jgi:hypothetical protein
LVELLVNDGSTAAASRWTSPGVWVFFHGSGRLAGQQGIQLLANLCKFFFGLPPLVDGIQGMSAENGKKTNDNDS